MAGQTVWMPDRNEEAKVVQEAGTGSYEVETSEGMYRRNHTALIPTPEIKPNDINTSVSEEMPNDKTEPYIGAIVSLICQIDLIQVGTFDCVRKYLQRGDVV